LPVQPALAGLIPEIAEIPDDEERVPLRIERIHELREPLPAFRSIKSQMHIA
jgi:hypothetical protein